MGKGKRTHIKATRTQLERMRREVLIQMGLCSAVVLVLLGIYVMLMNIMGLFSPVDGAWRLFKLVPLLVFGAMFLILADLPAFFLLWKLLPKYRRIDYLLYPEDYAKWLRLKKTDMSKLPKEDVQTAHSIYKDFRPRLPYGREELEALLKKELKREWYRRLTIAMLCGLLLSCPDFTDTALLRRALTERKAAAQYIFPVWLECMEGRTIHDREIIAAQFLAYWDKKLYKGR